MSIVDGREGKQYDSVVVKKPFSPDGQRIAYTGDRNGVSYAVVDEMELGPYDNVARLTFSPNSRHLVYFIYQGSNPRAIGVNGKVGPFFDTVFLSVGKMVFDSEDTFHYLAGRYDTIYLVEEKIVLMGNPAP